MDGQCYEQYPARIVALALGVAWAIYLIGALLLGRLWWPLAVAYLAFVLWGEVNVMRKNCVNCAYYGTLCALGKGKLAGLLFGRGDPAQFAARQATWRDVLPDMLASAAPLVGGIVVLIRGFRWGTLLLLALFVALTLGGNAVVRGMFACKHCKQRELGCPAEQLFGGKPAKGPAG